MRRKRDTEKVAAIIRDAGGKIVGRTRLQKTGYLLELAGLGEGFSFEYRHYGPFSEELASAARDANALGLISEEEHQAGWGGLLFHFYDDACWTSKGRSSVADNACAQAGSASAIELELAATAAFLADEGSGDPWADTARFKPDKAQGGRLENAKALYSRLQQIDTPKPLPRIA